MTSKIGIGITTCNRPLYLKCLLDSLHVQKCSFNELVVVNDGAPLSEDTASVGEAYDFSHVPWLQNKTNLGVAKSKNKALKYLLEKKCEHIFLIEDDCIITNPNVFNEYIKASQETGIKHFNFGPGSPWNRIQEDPSIIGDLSKRQLSSQKGKPNPRLIVTYKNNVSISTYQHIVAMFCYFHRSILEEIGLMDEDFYNAWEHVEHTWRIIRAKKYSPFWNFADITGSENYIKEQENEKANTTLAKNEEEFIKRVQDGLVIFQSKHNIIPSLIQDSTKQQVIQSLKYIYEHK